MLINPWRFAATSGVATPTLDTATAWWSPAFYDAGNDRLTEQRGTGLHLQLGSTVGADSNDPTFGDDGTYKHLLFDGTNDYLECSDAALDPAADSFSVVVAYTPLTLSSTRGIVTRREGADNGFMLRTNSANLQGVLDAGDPDFATSSATMTVGTRYRVALIRDGAAFRVVLDGTASAPTTYAGSISTAQSTRVGVGWTLGAPSSINQMRLNGVAWFTAALSDVDADAAAAELLAVAAL